MAIRSCTLGGTTHARPLSPLIVITPLPRNIPQPIDTVKANMMGLEAGKYGSSFNCVRELVRAGGVRSLFFGVVPRAVRVFIEARCKIVYA